VFDDTKNVNEIKLGQNASFIFAVCEYLKKHNNERFLEAAQKVANGILTFHYCVFSNIHILQI
jgi:hypothetical protein